MNRILDSKKLKAGDILLYSDDSHLSRRIRENAASQFSHAILYMGEHSFMEAISEGVTFFSTNRFRFPDDSCKLICKRLINYNDEIGNRITREARKYCYRAFNRRGIFALQGGATPSTEDQIDWNGPVFCTQLVGASYRDAGVPLNSLSLHNFTPKHIEESELLINVTNFLKEIPSEIAGEYSSYVDDQEGNELLNKQTEVTQNAWRTICDKFQENGFDKPHDLQYAFQSLATMNASNRDVADRIVASALAESGYLDLWRDHERLNPQLYNPHLLSEVLDPDFINNSNELLFLDELISILDSTIEFQEKNLEISQRNYERSSLQTFRVLSEMYNNFVESVKKAKLTSLFVREALKKFSEAFEGFPFNRK